MGYAIAGLYAILVGLYVPILTTLLKLNREVGVISQKLDTLSERISHLEEAKG